MIVTSKGGKKMSVKTFALIWGVLFLLAGASGYIPGLHTPTTHAGLEFTHGSSNALHLFPVNTLHNAAHLLFGVWGLLAARSVGAARGYAKVVAIAYGLLIVLGLIPQTNTFFGYVPLFGNDVWLHAILALPAAYFGFVHKETAVDRH
jgi:hypothetical protein